MKSRVGTPAYVSPGVLKGEYDESCDSWAVGCILYVMLSGYDAFYGEDEEEIYDRVKKCQLEFNTEEFEVVTDDAKDLISKLINFKPLSPA